jgi:hypothetical protein
MTCRPCQVLAQLGYNYLLIFDKVANTALLGDPGETLSRRFARGRDAGDRFCKFACTVLNVFSKGHCDWALEPGSLGREIWSWSHPDDNQKVVVVPNKMGSDQGFR